MWSYGVVTPVATPARMAVPACSALSDGRLIPGSASNSGPAPRAADPDPLESPQT